VDARVLGKTMGLDVFSWLDLPCLRLVKTRKMQEQMNELISTIADLISAASGISAANLAILFLGLIALRKC
jgi:hypothetical protein